MDVGIIQSQPRSTTCLFPDASQQHKSDRPRAQNTFGGCFGPRNAPSLVMRSSTPQQHRAASASYPPNDTSYPTTIPSTSPSGNGSLRRKGSFSFLRRSKSRDRSASDGSTPRRKLSKKERSKVWQQEMMSEQVPSRPPRIPNVPRQPDLQTFGIGDTMTTVTYRPGGPSQPRLAQKSSQETIGADMYRGTAIPPVPPIPAIPGAMLTKSPYIDSVARSESMTHRGRYSYASSLISTINSPRKIRRRKDPTPFKWVQMNACCMWDTKLTAVIAYWPLVLAASVRHPFLTSYAPRSRYHYGSSVNNHMTIRT